MKRLSLFVLGISILLILSFFFTGFVEGDIAFLPHPGLKMDLTLMPSISWDGGGDGTSWQDKDNWTGDRLPEPSDDVLIDVSENPTILFTASAGDVQIKSLTCHEAIEISGGSLALTGPTSSEITASLMAESCSLTATGAGTIFTASGPTSLTNVNLTAADGGVLSFPGAAAYTSRQLGNTLQASGAGSRIDLSHLTTLVGANYYGIYLTQLNALDGGEIDLAGEISGDTVWTLSGSTSKFNADGVTQLGNATITLIDGLSITFPAVSSINSCSLNVASGGQLSFPIAGNITGSTLTLASGGSITCPAVSDYSNDTITATGAGTIFTASGPAALNNVNLTAADGGVLAFPEAISYTSIDRGNVLQASGPGSKIDLSHLKTLAGANYYGIYPTQLNALDGGEIDLAGEISGDSAWTLSGSGSRFMVDEVSKLGQAAITVADGLSITFPLINAVSNSSFYLNSGGSISCPAVSDFSNDTITATGFGTVFTAVGTATLANVNLTAADGGVMAFPGAVSYSNPGGGCIILASGAGSKIDLSHLTSFAGADIHDYVSPAQINALNGGEIDLGGEISKYTSLTASGTASIFDVAAVTKLSGNIFRVNVSASDGCALDFSNVIDPVDTNLSAATGGSISFPSALSITGAGLTAATGGHISFIQAASVTNANLSTATGGSISFPKATNVTNSGLSAVTGEGIYFLAAETLLNVSMNASEGGTITFPSAVSYSNPLGCCVIQASGAGSKIDLSHLASFSGSDYYWENVTQINASSGGEIDLGGEILQRTQSTISGIDSILDFSSFTGINNGVIFITGDATLSFPAECSIEFTGNNNIIVDSSGHLVNNGTLSVLSTGSVLSISGEDFTNRGLIQALNNGTISIYGSIANNSTGALKCGPSSILSISGSLTGNTMAYDRYEVQGTLNFSGSGNAAAPQLLEVMGRNLEIDSSGFTHNFACWTLSLDNNTYLKLIDASDNCPGNNPEALYVDSLVVHPGTTLDLNGLPLYARSVQISGAVTGGTVVLVPDCGPIPLDSYVPGAISAGGETDEWTFYGRAGRSVTIVVNTGGSSPAAVSPYLSWAQVRLLDSNNNALADLVTSAAGDVLTSGDIVMPADGSYKVQVRAPAGHTGSTGNYLIGIWNVTINVSPLLLNQQYLGNIETAYSVDRWTFTALAGQQVKFDLLRSATAGILFSLNGPNGWSGFIDIFADSDLITLPSAGAYSLVAHASSGKYGGAYSFRLTETDQTDLTPNSPFNGVFVGSGQAQLFRVNLTSSSPLLVHLEDSDSAGHNELYARHGLPPTRGVYDFRFSDLSSANQEILVPMASPGHWYILVYADFVPSTSDYTLLATTSDLVLTAVTPDHHGNGVDAVLTLTGAGFDSALSVELVAPDKTVYSSASIEIDSFSQATAVFQAGTVPAGTYTVRIVKPESSPAELIDAFKLTSSGESRLETNLVVPGTLGRHATATIYIEYTNKGDVAMPAPLLLLDASQDKALLTLDSTQVVSGFWTTAIPEGFSSIIQIQACGATPGILQPGESCRIPVYYVGLQQPWDFGDNQVEFELGVLKTDNSTAVDWNALKSQVKPDFVNQEAWDAIWSNFVGQVGNTWGSYLAALNEDAAYLGRLGYPTSDIGSLLGFELRQADSISPVGYLGNITDAAVPTPGLQLSFERVYGQPISRRYEIGPLGRGWTFNWQYSLTLSGDGTIVITDMSGTPRIFQSDGRLEGIYHSTSGNDETLSFWDNGGLYVLREPDGTSIVFGPDKKLKYIEDIHGTLITAGWDGDLLTSLRHSSGQFLNLDYNPAGRVRSITDSLGRQTLYTYDESYEHLIAVQDLTGKTTSYSYSSGQSLQREHGLIRIVSPGDISRYFTYDDRGRLTDYSLNDNAEKVHFSYNSTGIVTSTDLSGNSTRFYIDNSGSAVKVENANGSTVALTRDQSGNVTGITDPSGRSNLYDYDSKKRVVRMTDTLGRMTQFSYSDKYNQLTSITDAKQNVTKYSYDSSNNLKAIIYPDNSIESWSYDTLGQATGWTNRRGQAVGFSYDAGGRLTGKTSADGSHIEYVYDSRGNLTSATDNSGTTVFSYDASDYLTRIDYPGGQWLQFSCDAAGRRTSSLDQTGHQVNYFYDAAGRLASLTDESSQTIAAYTYDASGRISSTTLGNGVNTQYQYDAVGQLIHLVNYSPENAVLSRCDYTYDSRGRRVSMDTLDGHWTYEYDDMAQLVHAVLTSANPDIPDQDLQYEYDALGNRIRTIENGVTTDYVTNNLNQYVKAGNTTYSFDADGNLIKEETADSTTNYSYDDENRLTQLSRGPDTWRYFYDALGNRTATSENGTITRHIIDPAGLGNLVGEYDGSNNLIAHYDHGYGLLSRMDAEGSAAYYTFDAMGNVQQMITAAGTVANTYCYEPFGSLLSSIQTIPNRFQYAGEAGVTKDPGGLTFMRARFYSSQLGRFLTADPLTSGIEPDSMNYALNAPTLFIDPSGLMIIGAGAIIGGTVGLVSYAATWAVCGDGSIPGLIGATVGGAVSGAFAAAGIPGVITNFQAGFIGSLIAELGDQIGKGKINIRELTLWSCIGGLMGIMPAHYDVNKSHAIRSLKRTLLGKNKAGKELARGAMNGTVPGNAFCAWKKIQDLIYPPVDDLPGGGGGIGGAWDPNQKTGPAGAGDAGYIYPGGDFAYRIDFENESTATAPAQQVVISDQLDSNLDWNTFQWSEIGFGDQLVAIPANTQHFETMIPFTYNETSFEVQIITGIDSSTGKITASYYSIDPDTGLPPPVNTGFLPPEDNTGRGMGHISYTIRPKSDLAVGSEIRNIALISFDGQPQIATNQLDPHDPSIGTDPTKECLNTITLQGAPTAVNDWYQTAAWAPLEIPAPGILYNDSDPLNKPLTVELVSGPLFGDLILNGDGSFGYTPHIDYPSSDNFTYRVYNGSLYSNVALVYLAVYKKGSITKIASSENPSTYGQPVTFTVSVVEGKESAGQPHASGTLENGEEDTGIPTGTVTFKDGPDVMKVVELDASAQATWNTTELTVGDHVISALYSGDHYFFGNNWNIAQVTQSVNKGTTGVTLSSSSDQSIFGQSVTFTALVEVLPPAEGAPAGAPTGLVVFKDGETVLSTMDLPGSGQAAFSTSALSIGEHSLTAQYSGDDNFEDCLSEALLQGVYPDTLYIITSSLADGDAKAAYSKTLKVINGVKPYTWSIKKGSKLPSGLKLKADSADTSTASIAGKPSKADAYTFSIQVNDSKGAYFERELKLLVHPAIKFSTHKLPTVEVNVAFPAWSPTVSGGNGKYIWEYTGTLPPGLNVNSSTGAISGTPQASGAFPVTLIVKDTLGGIAAKKLSLKVLEAVSILPLTLPNGDPGVTYKTTTLKAAGGTQKYTWTTNPEQLPAGLALSSKGAIKGKPAETSSGVYTFTVQVNDGLGTVTLDFEITIYQPLVINALPPGAANQPYSQVLSATGGSGGCTFKKSGTWPAWLKLDSKKATISGTPPAPGTYQFHLKVTDSMKGSKTQMMILKIMSPPE
jgi:RHS repeat-associated protein